mmetsp:Transcript_3124/g.5338  ORF Transcript_3124/g.5338 Transcript_3124/m.5338 type:complete len:251 (+) Transcript_3124:242-994(+)
MGQPNYHRYVEQQNFQNISSSRADPQRIFLCQGRTRSLHHLCGAGVWRASSFRRCHYQPRLDLFHRIPPVRLCGQRHRLQRQSAPAEPMEATQHSVPTHGTAQLGTRRIHHRTLLLDVLCRVQGTRGVGSPRHDGRRPDRNCHHARPLPGSPPRPGRGGTVHGRMPRRTAHGRPHCLQHLPPLRSPPSMGRRFLRLVPRPGCRGGGGGKQQVVKVVDVPCPQSRGGVGESALRRVQSLWFLDSSGPAGLF